MFAAVHESLVGTFRTCRDVRLESVGRTRAELTGRDEIQFMGAVTVRSATYMQPSLEVRTSDELKPLV